MTSIAVQCALSCALHLVSKNLWFSERSHMLSFFFLTLEENLSVSFGVMALYKGNVSLLPCKHFFPLLFPLPQIGFCFLRQVKI